MAIEKTILVCCFYLFLFKPFAHSQKSYQPYLLHWTEKDGLSDNTVYRVAKDHHGFLWIGTSNGISRFDGRHFENFRYDPKDSTSLAGNIAVQLYTASNGKVWVGTDGGGLSIFDYQSGDFKNLQQNLTAPMKGLSENRVYSFLEDRAQNMLIGYRAIGSGAGGISIIDSSLQIKEHLLQNVSDYAGFPMKVMHILPDSDAPNLYWLAGRSFYLWDRKTNMFQEFPHPGFVPNYTSISGLLTNSDSTFLVGLYFDGLWEFNFKQRKWSRKLHDRGISSISKNAKGLIWITDEHGIGEFDQNEEVIHYEFLRWSEVSPFPEQGSINDIQWIDNILWICTNNGLYAWNATFDQFNTRQFRENQDAVHYPKFVGAINETTWCFTDQDKGLVLTNEKLEIKKAVALPANKKIIQAVLIGEKEEAQVLIGTDQGLYLWNAYANTILPYRVVDQQHDTDSISVWSMKYNDGMVYIGTRLSGLYRLNWLTERLNVFQHIAGDSNSLCHNKYLFEIEKDADNRFWICTDKGLSILNPANDQFEHYAELDFLQSYVIHSLEMDGDNCMWIGTRDRGLFRFNLSSRALAQYSVSDGLAYNGVNRMLYKDGLLWMTTREGLCRMNIHENKVTVYDEGKGLYDQTLYNAALSLLPDDRIMLTYQNSSFFSLFTDQSLSTDIQSPIVNLRDLVVLNGSEQKRQYLYDEDQVALGPHENYFTISFQGIDFLRAKELRYKYILENYHDYWIDATASTTAVFTNIPGGQYTFKVQAINKDERKSPIRSIVINLATPWYKTRWFLTLLVFLSALMVYGIYHYRIRQIRRQASFKNQLAELEMKALRSQINPHFIFNCLNSIKGYIIDHRIEDGTHYVGQFAQLIRMTLNHSKQKLIPLSKEMEAIRIYTWLEQERLNNQFSVEFDFSLKHPAEQLVLPPMLLQPYVENAIWHGLMPLEGHGKLWITIEEIEDKLVFKISDDGIGRAASADRKKQSLFSKPSFGMEITESRLAQINQLYQIASTITISDLNPGAEHPGTLVKIVFPKIINHEKT